MQAGKPFAAHTLRENENVRVSVVAQRAAVLVLVHGNVPGRRLEGVRASCRADTNNGMRSTAMLMVRRKYPIRIVFVLSFVGHQQ